MGRGGRGVNFRLRLVSKRWRQSAEVIGVSVCQRINQPPRCCLLSRQRVGWSHIKNEGPLKKSINDHKILASGPHKASGRVLLVEPLMELLPLGLIIIPCHGGRSGSIGAPTVRTHTRRPSTAFEMYIQTSLGLPSDIHAQPSVNLPTEMPIPNTSPRPFMNGAATAAAGAIGGHGRVP